MGTAAVLVISCVAFPIGVYVYRKLKYEDFSRMLARILAPLGFSALSYVFATILFAWFTIALLAAALTRSISIGTTLGWVLLAFGGSSAVDFINQTGYILYATSWWSLSITNALSYLGFLGMMLAIAYGFRRYDPPRPFPGGG